MQRTKVTFDAALLRACAAPWTRLAAFGSANTGRLKQDLSAHVRGVLSAGRLRSRAALNACPRSHARTDSVTDFFSRYSVLYLFFFQKNLQIISVDSLV